MAWVSSGVYQMYLPILGLGWGETEKIGVWDAVIGKGIQVNIATMWGWRGNTDSQGSRLELAPPVIITHFPAPSWVS